MGVDARWVCHSCKTICCANGFRDLWAHPKKIPTPEDIYQIIESTEGVAGGLIKPDELPDLGKALKFLEVMAGWLSRHRGHDILIANDYMLDLIDLEEYRTEEVDGTIHSLTKYGEQVRAAKEAEEQAVRRIQKKIEEYASGWGEKSLEEVAREIFHTCPIIY